MVNPGSNPDYKVDKAEDEPIHKRRMFLHALIRASMENSLPLTYPLSMMLCEDVNMWLRKN